MAMRTKTADQDPVASRTAPETGTATTPASVAKVFPVPKVRYRDAGQRERAQGETDVDGDGGEDWISFGRGGDEERARGTDVADALCGATHRAHRDAPDVDEIIRVDADTESDDAL
jgi:hypothetical protein